jgi:hypothetical protein
MSDDSKDELIRRGVLPAEQGKFEMQVAMAPAGRPPFRCRFYRLHPWSKWEQFSGKNVFTPLFGSNTVEQAYTMNRRVCTGCGLTETKALNHECKER